MSRLRSFSQQAAARDKRILAAAIPHVKYMCAPINLQPALMPSTVYSLCLLFSLIFVLYIHFLCVCVAIAFVRSSIVRSWSDRGNITETPSCLDLTFYLSFVVIPTIFILLELLSSFIGMLWEIFGQTWAGPNTHTASGAPKSVEQMSELHEHTSNDEKKSGASVVTFDQFGIVHSGRRPWCQYDSSWCKRFFNHPFVFRIYFSLSVLMLFKPRCELNSV